jgi:DNA-binding response OmpR family regulator
VDDVTSTQASVRDHASGQGDRGLGSILVVEDAPEVTTALLHVLRGDGFTAECVHTGLDALEAVRTNSYDVIVLDVGLPDIDGVEVLRRLRAFSDAFVILLTARNDSADRIIGLSAGADDYVAKPCPSRELLLRIQAMLRRGRASAEPDATPVVLEHERLRIDVPARAASWDGTPVALSARELDLLQVLVANPTTNFSSAQLLELVWGEGWYGDAHVVEVVISRLRKRLAAASGLTGSQFIRNTRGIGYRLGPCHG